MSDDYRAGRGVTAPASPTDSPGRFSHADVARPCGSKPHRHALFGRGGVRPRHGIEASWGGGSNLGLSSAAPSIEANRGAGDTERQRVTEDRFEMNEELEEPTRIVELGRTGLYTEPDDTGSNLLHGSEGTVIAAPFTRFARELVRWVQGADLQD
jgi:hypothetical protein